MADINTNSLTDLFSTAKNLVIALNDLTQAWRLGQGNKTSQNLLGGTTTVLVSGSSGRVARVSVTVAGAPGGIYDSTSTSPAAASLLALIPDAEGVWEMNIPYLYGLVIVTGAAQEATVVYS